MDENLLSIERIIFFKTLESEVPEQPTKMNINIDGASKFIINLLEEIQISLFNQAFEFKETNTHVVNDFNEFKSIISKGGFIKCGWDGKTETELKIKRETNATIRCIPLNQKKDKNLKCIYTQNPAKHEVIFAKAY